MPGDHNIPFPRTVPRDEESARAERETLKAVRAAEKRLRDAMANNKDGFQAVVEAMFKPESDCHGFEPEDETINGGFEPHIDPTAAVDVEQLQKAMRMLAQRVTALEEALGKR